MESKDNTLIHFRDIHLKFVRMYTRILNHTGLTLPKYALLSQLVAFGDMAMTEASQRLYISKAAISFLVRRLEKEGFLKRRPHPKDQRSYLLHVLPKGRKIVLKAQSCMLGFIFQALSGLKAEERKFVEKFYAQISQTLDHALNQPKSEIKQYEKTS